MKTFLTFQKKLFNTLFLVFISFSPLALAISSWTEDTLFIMPKDGRKPWLEAINEAKISIDMSAYRLSDSKIVAALERASQRNVKINLLLEPDPAGHDKTNNVKTPVERLETMNQVKIFHLSKDFKQAHYKMAVIDKRIGLISTGNLDEESFEGIPGKEEACRDFIVPVFQSDTVAEMLRVFQADCRHQKIAPNNISLIWGPDHQRSEYERLIQSAKKKIRIYQQDIQDEKMANLIANMAKEGKDVQLIMMPYPFGHKEDKNIPNQNLIFENGGKVGLCKAHYIHAKIIIIDDEMMYLGSCNMYPSSLDSVRELGILIDNPKIIQQVIATFDEDWNSSDLMKEKRTN
ncbi:MAG: phospholipase D-like domain-containing protein [Janthinobacterium lividum]